MKKFAEVTGAAAAATGTIALGSLIATGAAVGAVVSSFRQAGHLMADALKREKTPPEEQAEDAVAQVESMEADTVSAN